jgi:hypothetical protein
MFEPKGKKKWKTIHYRYVSLQTYCSRHSYFQRNRALQLESHSKKNYFLFTGRHFGFPPCRYRRVNSKRMYTNPEQHSLRRLYNFLLLLFTSNCFPSHIKLCLKDKTPFYQNSNSENKLGSYDFKSEWNPPLQEG